MLKTYFLIIRAIPSAKNHNALTLPSIEAHFWVRENSAEGALRRARFYLKQNEWISEETELQPTPTSAMEYQPSATGMYHYRQAQRFGITMCIK